LGRNVKAPRSRATRQSPTPGRFDWRIALILVAGALSYAGGLSGPFVFDDRGSIIDNRTIEDLGSLEVLRAPHETPTAGRPAVNVSFALNYALGERNVTGYHVANIAIHLLCGLAILGIARRLQPNVNAAFAIALIWTIHPLNSEAVNYVTQRSESLMALCYLLTIYCAVRAFDAPSSRTRWEAAAVLACAVGMASKESMVTAPIAVLVVDRIFLLSSFRARWRLYAGLGATWIILAALVWTSPRDLSAGFAAHDANVWMYLLNQAVMLARYLWLAIWPRDLVLYYGWPLPLTLDAVLPQAALVIALLALTAYALWRHPRAGFLGAWFFLALAPTSSIVPIVTEVGAERRMYLGLIAVVALGVIAFRALVRIPQARAAVLAVAALALGLGTVARTAEYQSSLTLAETTLARWPTPAAHSMLGTELAAAGQLSAAEGHLRQAAPVHPPAQYYLGTVLAAQEQHAGAIDSLKTFIASQPPELDQVHTARAVLAGSLTKEGRLDEAADQYRAMLATNPDDGQALSLLASILLRQQRHGDAIALYRRAVASRPGDVTTTIGLGVALASHGLLDEAITVFREAVALDPANPHAQQNLARALAIKKAGLDSARPAR
jgi:tetratricopeptide (TPR) repeat protein